MMNQRSTALALAGALSTLFGCASEHASKSASSNLPSNSGGEGADHGALVPSPITFLELHWLREAGGGMAAARNYVHWVRPIAERHRANVLQVFQVDRTLKGNLSPAAVWVYQIANQLAMQEMMQDQEYAANIPNRDRLWDFNRNQLLSVRPLLSGETELATPDGWLNFVELHWVKQEGGGIEAARRYVDWVRPLARRHGGEVAQVYEVLATPKGDLKPSLVWIYRFPNPPALQGLMEDREYVANIPNRDRLSDFDRNQLLGVSGILR